LIITTVCDDLFHSHVNFMNCSFSVMEMPNLHPHPLVRPDFVVADSWFVLSHSSLKHLDLALVSHTTDPYDSAQLFSVPLKSNESESFSSSSEMFPVYQSTRAEILSPGVDVTALHAVVKHHPPVPCPPGCGAFLPLHTRENHYFTTADRHHLRCGNCFTIGMVCRLSPEKSVGLFLLAAAELVNTFNCTFCRFVIVGDGALQHHLRELSARLQLTNHVQFMGWLTKESMMVTAVTSWDVAVTTGAWRETFSIAGLEQLALGVPLVTFASGGMGEYVSDPLLTYAPSPRSPPTTTTSTNLLWNCSDEVRVFISRLNLDHIDGDDDDGDDGHGKIFVCPFAISDNAIVVLDTHPQSLAMAVKYLETSPDDRSRIGFAGITTASQHFHLNKTRDLYQDFLLHSRCHDLHRPPRHSTTHGG
jgi:glycosyltransferase involved in cell wall biosynthesis